MNNILALVDCNSFFCSCERLFRPALKATPLIVLSNNDGCVVSRTQEAKDLGIPMGIPFFKIKDLCLENGVKTFSSNFSLYTNVSKRVMMHLSSLTDKTEIYSVDEAFLNLSRIQIHDFYKYGSEIKESTYENVGIPVSVGIASTKVLAKAASTIAKKKGVVCLLSESEIENALEDFPLNKLWGVGKGIKRRLESFGINNALELRNYKNKTRLKSRIGQPGLFLQDELLGINRYQIKSDNKRRKTLLSSRSFGKPIFLKEDLKCALANFTTRACEKLRGEGSVCSRVEIFFRTSPFKEIEQVKVNHGKNLIEATNDTMKIIETVFELVDETYRKGIEYKKAGILLSNISPESEKQLSLLDFNEHIRDERKDKLMNVIDGINQREGKRIVLSGACLSKEGQWKMNQEFKSQGYTTGFDNLPKAY